jgi:hypothetical protein
MPSRMKDEAFLYFVYGTSSRIRSHVACSMRKVTTRGFRVTRSPALREAAPIGRSAVLFMENRDDACLAKWRLRGDRAILTQCDFGATKDAISGS